MREGVLVKRRGKWTTQDEGARKPMIELGKGKK